MTFAETRSETASNADIFYRSHDDLVLYARQYGSDDLPGRPLVCLAGLTRNGRDFQDVAAALAAHPTHPRAVYCLDYRGRGHSQWDKNWQNYSAYTEMLDVSSFLTLRGLEDIAILGSSRGGIVATMLAVTRPSAIGCLALNDIGPAIETAGLARIMGYAGKIPVPRDWEEGNEILREMFKRHFPGLGHEDWNEFARRIWNEADGKPAAGCDPNVGKALSEVDIAKPVPTMWEHFKSLLKTPLMVLRGEHSDILSAATVQDMQERHPNMTAAVIQNEGHTPLLRDLFSQRLIGDFLGEADKSWNAPVRARMPVVKEVSEAP